jgi:glycosyltransferase involved in cell wall biosynthesis
VKTKLRKIAILADFPWSFFEQGATGRGGGQACTWLAQLAEEFAKQSRYQIHWISLDRSRAWGSSERRVWENQSFHRIPAGRTKVDLALGYRPSQFLLGRALRRVNPDLLHCWGTERSYPIMCGWEKIPSILSMQGVLTEYQRIGSFKGNPFWENLVKWEPRFLRAATVVTCESQWGIGKVKEVCPELNTRQVEYGVHPSFYKLRWTPDDAAPYVLYSGSIDARKGVDILLDAVESIADRRWTLKLAGDGPLREALEARGVPRVEWLGLLNWEDLQGELSQASCVVLPTRADTSPNVVKEARVIGLPVITSIHGGQAGYIRDGENGFIVNPLNPQGLAHALQKLMNDPELARKMGATRYEEDRAYLLPSNTARGFMEIYDELLGSKNCTPLEYNY